MSRYRWVIVLAAAASCLAVAAPSQAAFPGANGRIAFGEVYVDEGAGGENQILTMNPDGRGHLYVTDGQEPAWSPDGSKIAFRSESSDIYVIDADRTDLTQLTNNPAGDGSPAWSPDGTKIAFTSGRDGNGEIYVMNADGTNQTRLTNNPAADDRPDWSPDGTKIAFVSMRDGNEEIYSMNADGTGAIDLTNDPGYQTMPSWSPDGSRIAFMRRPSASAGGWLGQLYVMGHDGSGQSRITSDAAAYSEPVWSPNGEKIAAWRSADFTDPLYSIAVMNPDGTDITPVYGTGADSYGYPIDWQPIPVTAYPRPKGASPFQTYLVPAYNPCTAPNKTHGSPLAFPSCSPPTRSSNLTLGTPDSNAQPANGLASVFLATRVGDLKVAVTIRDVRKADLSDYTGQLDVQTDLRITDKNNTPSPGGPGAATVTDSPLHVPVSCTATGSATLGSDCNITTTVDSLYAGAIGAGQRAVWALGQVKAYDGGADGLASTTGDNTLFLTQGIFIP
jgi:TolB protein